MQPPGSPTPNPRPLARTRMDTFSNLESFLEPKLKIRRKTSFCEHDDGMSFFTDSDQEDSEANIGVQCTW